MKIAYSVEYFALLLRFSSTKFMGYKTKTEVFLYSWFTRMFDIRVDF